MESYGFKIDHGMEESSLDSVHATDASLSLLDPVEAPDSEEMTPRVVPAVVVVCQTPWRWCWTP